MTRPNIEIVVEMCKYDAGKPEDCGDWYWAVKIDGQVYADGEEGLLADAERKAAHYYAEAGA